MKGDNVGGGMRGILKGEMGLGILIPASEMGVETWSSEGARVGPSRRGPQTELIYAQDQQPIHWARHIICSKKTGKKRESCCTQGK